MLNLLIQLDILKENFHFLRPTYLWLLALFFAILLIKQLIAVLSTKYSSSLNTDSWSNIINQKILQKLYVKKSNAHRHTSKLFTITQYLLLPLTIIFLIIALAGPSWQKTEIPLVGSPDNWVIILSLNQSMLKDDVSPTRLQRAKYKIKDFLGYLKDEHTGLIVFSEFAYDIIPLTSDKSTIEHILPSIDPLIMPSQGQNLSAALHKAQELISNLKLSSSNILLLTDTKADSNSLIYAQELRNEKVNINIINFDKQNSSSLIQLSKLSNGVFKDFTNNDQDIISIISSARQNKTSQLIASPLVHKPTLTNNYLIQGNKYILWQDMGPWLLIILLPVIFIVILYHRRSLYIIHLIYSITIILLLNSMAPTQLYAESQNNSNTTAHEQSNFWLNQQQQEAKNLLTNKNNKNYTSNPEVFSDPYWQAISEYKNNNYTKATELFEKYNKSQTDQTNKNSIDQRYNYANSLAKSGNIQQAIEQYQIVLQDKPVHHDAKFNKNLLENYLAKQNKKQDNTHNQNNQHKNSDNTENHENSSNNSKQNELQNQNNDQNKNKTERQPQDQASDQDLNQNDNQNKNNKNSGEYTQDRYNQNLDHNTNQAQEQDDNNKNNDDNNQQLSEEQQVKNRQTEKWLSNIPDNPAQYLKKQLLFEYWKEKQP